ncbi:ABC-2 type transporter-domain-containing protein [Vararia minispora EC-137]|uniref:ABC-2 type transporter-domain-containing protein n=1 Tax=Vararia minispora EC-137 TaxID=1314806 RepID=A0ACB8QV98_9AGAM|nr:ABC-2 type transporter-domain-containing protein [Vararia minispora EC-137]
MAAIIFLSRRPNNMSDAGPHNHVESEEIDGPPSPLIQRRALAPVYGAMSDPAASPAPNQAPSTRRRNSSVSHVELDHFDPSGMAELRRTLTGPQSIISNASIHAARPEASGAHERQASVHVSEETLFGPPVDGNFDLEKTLKSAFRKLDEQGIPQRELGVAFKDLRVQGIGSTSSHQETLGSLLNPLYFPERVRNAVNPPVRDILAGFEGVVRPGEMLLVLGSPGSGCTTLLKTLANQRHEFHHIEGDVYYDSFSPQEIEKHYRGDAIYVPEDDIHFPTLKVDETLRFASKMRAPRNRIDGVSRDEFNTHTTEIIETVFGLRHVKDTPVGDSALRGVSGGEKKRVSIGEALALRARIGAWDNSTRGLDSSTALEYVRALRIATDVARVTTIVSIYQAGESLYQHFDKVCVIYEGRMAYFGRADKARQYFIDMGFEPANRQTTPDFLVAVTDPNGRITRNGYQDRTPTTAAEFAETFLASDLGKENRVDVEAYLVGFVERPERKELYRSSVIAEHAKTQKKGSPYTISLFMQARAVALRRLQILRGNIVTEAIQVATFVLQAIINGTVFYRISDATSAYFSRGGVLFFALLFAALTSMAEIPALFGQRPIVLKHYRAAMYHPFIEALALTIVDIPITFITLSLFCIILYFLVGLQESASQFFVFFLFIFSMSLAMKAWFRAVAAAFGKPAPAQTVAGILLLGLVLYTGYSIPRPSMIGALKWITWLNPMRYAFESLMSNEFRTIDGPCASLAPSGPAYENVTIVNQVCTTVGSLPGQDRVSGDRFLALSYEYYYSNTWRNFGIVLAFGIAFTIVLLIFTEFNTAASTEFSVMLFKRGSMITAPEDARDGTDAEKGPVSPVIPRPAEEEGALREAEKMNDVFTWRHLEYEVPVGHGEMRRLLDDVSGYVAPGRLTALMGESGAGKTTLLNVLAQRQTTGIVRGERLVNGRPLPPDFQAQTGYCQQMDTHLAELTVRESLLFSAKLRQPPEVPLSEKKAYVETVLKMCGLEEYGDAVVGSLGVEHRKRTTIGVELAAKPKLLLFLDEPTSGLDSQSAWAIVSFLRKLADHGQAILCTIHQPSAELFQVFDRLLLLRKGGQTVYFGDIGRNATTLLNYFQRNGGYPCPADANPAEYILDVIGAGATATTTADWHDIWKKSLESRSTDAELESILEDGKKRAAVDTTQHSEFSTSWVYQVKTLLERELVRHWRDPTYLVAKFALNICGALFIGFTFFKAKDSIQGTQNKIFAVFMSTILSAPLSNQIQVPFITTRGVYEVRERPSRMYSWTAFVTAQFFGELPFNIFGSTLYFLIWYWLVALPTGRAGYTYLMLGIIFPTYYTSLAQAIAAMSPNTEIAALLFSFLFSFVVTFNGVLQPFRLLGWWKWMYRLSPYTYLIEGLIGQAVGRESVTCSSTEIVQLEPPSGQTCGQYMAQYIAGAGGYVVNSDATSACQFCSISETDQFLYGSFNIQYSNHWRNFGLMWVYVGFNIFAIFALTWLFRQGGLRSFMRLFIGRRS